MAFETGAKMVEHSKIHLLGGARRSKIACERHKQTNKLSHVLLFKLYLIESEAHLVIAVLDNDILGPAKYEEKSEILVLNFADKLCCGI